VKRNPDTRTNGRQTVTHGPRSVRCIKTLGPHGCGSTMAMSPDERFILSGTCDDNLWLTDLDTAKPVQQFRGSNGAIGALAFCPDGRRVISTEGAGSHCLRLWDVETGKCIHTFHGTDANPTESISVSHDGRILVSSGQMDPTVSVWEIESGKRIHAFGDDLEYSRRVCMARDASWALSGHNDGSLHQWDLTSGHHMREITGYHRQGVDALSLSSDDRLAVSAGDGHVCVWNVSTGRCLMAAEGHTNWEKAAVLTSDSRYAISGSADETVRFWDVATGKCVSILDEDVLGVVKNIALCHDDRVLVTSNCDGIVAVWEIDWETSPTRKWWKFWK